MQTRSCRNRPTATVSRANVASSVAFRNGSTAVVPVRSHIAFISNAEFTTRRRAELLKPPIEMYQAEEVTREVTSSSAERSGPALGVGKQLSRAKLLTHEGELFLFRKLNYLKYLAATCLEKQGGRRPRGASAKSKERRGNDCRDGRPSLREGTFLPGTKDDINSCVDPTSLLQEAEKTRNLIVQANLRLVSSLARKFANSQIEYEELVSEGHLILLGAVEKYDYSRGFHFSTYATSSIQRHYYRYLHRIQRRRKMEMLSSDDRLPEAEIDTVDELSRAELADVKVSQRLLNCWADCLDERERLIVAGRFGLEGEEPGQTLKALSAKIGFSKERVRQLQLRAIEKLRDLATTLHLQRADG